MIENIKQMQRRHDKEIEKLRKLCKHKKTNRMPFMWAPGHFGADVEVCEWCGKVIKTYDGMPKEALAMVTGQFQEVSHD